MAARLTEILQGFKAIIEGVDGFGDCHIGFVPPGKATTSLQSCVFFTTDAGGFQDGETERQAMVTILIYFKPDTSSFEAGETQLLNAINAFDALHLVFEDAEDDLPAALQGKINYFEETDGIQASGYDQAGLEIRIGEELRVHYRRTRGTPG